MNIYEFYPKLATKWAFVDVNCSFQSRENIMLIFTRLYTNENIYWYYIAFLLTYFVKCHTERTCGLGYRKQSGDNLCFWKYLKWL